MDAQERFTNINESYKYSGSGTLYFTEGKRDKTGATYEETTAIANHAPILKERRIIDNGIETSEELVYSAFRGGKSGPATGITLKDLYSQTPQMKFGAACRIYPGKGAVTRYRECMQMQCEDFPETTVYQHTGYTMIDGERIFLNGGNSVTRDGLTSRYNVDLPGPLGLYGFTERKDEGRYKTLLSVLPAVAPAPLVYAGLGVAFLSPLNRLLREIGLEPMFVLYFTGKTGSGKSTFARLLLNFFGDYDKSAPPPASFNDTPNALEMKLALTDSTLVLADDRIPSTTPAIRAKMEAMEQRIVRMIGERVGRGRLNADSTMKTVYRPVANVLVTAEEAFSNIGESGAARALSVSIKPGDIDFTSPGNAITRAQRDAGHLNQCMGEYIAYVIGHWDEIKERAAGLFQEYRDAAQNGGHARLAEAVAHLQLGIYYMCTWLQSAHVIDEAQAAAMQGKAWEIFLQLAEEQNRRITAEKPVNLFLSAVRAMLDNKEIRTVKPGTDSDFTGPTKAGYEDDEYFYFDPARIYVKVREFYAAQDRAFPLGQSALFGHLADDGIIVTDEGPSGKRQFTKGKRFKGINGGRPVRYLWVRKSALQEDDDAEQG